MDDVVVKTAQSIIDNNNATYGTNMVLENFYSRDPSVWGAPDEETAIRRVNEYLDTEEYFQSLPVQEAIHTLRGLDRYHRLYIVTGRPDFTEVATHRWLKEHLPDLFEDVVFTNFFDKEKVRSKGDVCRELGATVLIDDHPEHCVSALEAGVRPLLFGSYPWNISFELPEGIERVEGWPDIQRIFLPDEQAE